MPWAKFDDRYPWHRKIRPLSDAAFRLDVSAVCWCAENLTDGRIRTDELCLVSDVKRPAKAAAELVSQGRWHWGEHGCESCPMGEPGGYVIHDYLQYNPTREKVEEDREKRRKAGELGGKASGRSRSREANAKQSASGLLSKTEAPVASSPTNPRTRTRSLTPTTSVEGGSHVSSGPDDDPPLYPDRCSKHGNTYEPGNCGGCADVRKARLRLASIGPHNPATKPHCGECDEVRLLHTRFGTIPCPNCNPAAEAAS